VKREDLPQAVLQYDEDATCTEMLRGGSKSFFAASRLLGSAYREPATALYAFCRVADDAIDFAADPHEALEALCRRLDAIYAGEPFPAVADRAFAPVVAQYRIPRLLPQALLEGFAWDAVGRRYETLDELLDYAARVAGTVGAMMALIMGARAPQTLARACELGLAMQLTNIARDVGEDARNGRVYLPLQWLREAGVDLDVWLADPQPLPAVRRVTQRLLNEADHHYERSQTGIGELPRSCRPAMMAARLVYAEIGREVERRGCDSVTGRAVVSGRRKFALLLRASLAGARVPRAAGPLPVPPSVRFLVESVTGDSASLATPQSFFDRTVGIVQMFERVAVRERAQRAFQAG
jgi:phytoene synthase